MEENSKTKTSEPAKRNYGIDWKTGKEFDRIIISMPIPMWEAVSDIQTERAQRNAFAKSSMSSTARILLAIGIRIWQIGKKYGISNRVALEELYARVEEAAEEMQTVREAKRNAKKRRPTTNQKKPSAIMLISGLDEK